MEKLLYLLKEHHDFWPSDDRLSFMLSSILPESNGLLDEAELESVQAARGVWTGMPKNAVMTAQDKQRFNKE